MSTAVGSKPLQGLFTCGQLETSTSTSVSARSVSEDKPEHFFLERYRAAYAEEIAHFFDAMVNGTPLRTTVHDGLKALELAEAATTSWREQRIVHL